MASRHLGTEDSESTLHSEENMSKSKSAPPSAPVSRQPPANPNEIPTAVPVQPTKQEEVRGQVQQVLEIADQLNHPNISGNRVAELLSSVCSTLVKKQLDDMRVEHEEAMDRLRSELETKLDLQMKMAERNPYAPYNCVQVPVKVPQKLADNGENCPSLDRFFRLDRVYKNTPVFQDDGAISVRNFLNSIISITNSFPPSVMMTRNEYFSILWSKLGPTVQGELMDQLDEFAEEPDRLHNALLANYDESERAEEAFEKLQSLRPSPELGTVSKLLHEAKRLRQLTLGTENELARGFATSIKTFLPEELRMKLQDISMELSARTNMKHPDWKFLTSFMSLHREDIQEFINKLLNRPKPHAWRVRDEDDHWEDDDEEEDDDQLDGVHEESVDPDLDPEEDDLSEPESY